jgi:hypothetical protein
MMTQIITFGAGTGIQTLGLFLGKEALYQLSYTRTSQLIPNRKPIGKMFAVRQARICT